MLAKKYRFTPGANFFKSKETRTSYTLRLSLYAKKTNCHQPPRFACLIKRKLDKRASARNRTKRLIFAALAKILQNILPGFDILIKPKTVLKAEKLNDILPEVRQLFRRANLL